MATYVFGEGPGGDASGNHKDTYLISAATGACGASEVDLFVTAATFRALCRFDISAISAGETVTSAIVRLYLAANTLAGDTTISIYNLLTNWGITDTNEGASANPAAAGQATWRRSFDFDGAGGDVTWSAGNIGAGDFAGVAAGTTPIAAADPVGTAYNIDITALVSAWHTGTTANYGFGIFHGRGETVKFDSQESLTAAERPSLTVVTSAGGSIIIKKKKFGFY